MDAYFLGSNSAYGFYSCYEHLASADNGDFLWVIKGGPGCGKSTFMKKIAREAEKQGFLVEYIYCSGDPDSLDGIYIPDLHTAYTDGTSPHVQEPQYPAVRGAYLDLGQFYDIPSLIEKIDEVSDANKAYKIAYKTAYELLKEIPKPNDLPTCANAGKRRFLSALTCQGWVEKSDNLKKEITVSALREILDSTAENTIIYLHPLWPDLVQGVQLDGVNFMLDVEIPSCSSAVSWLQKAKESHDALEKIYYPHVNFDALDRFAEIHMEKYL